MVTVDIKFNLTGFQDGLRGLAKGLGLHERTVIKKETGELVKTLVRISPKATPENIRLDIERKFQMVESDALSDTSGRGDKWQTGKSGVTWYSVDSNYLRGI